MEQKGTGRDKQVIGIKVICLVQFYEHGAGLTGQHFYNKLDKMLMTQKRQVASVAYQIQLQKLQKSQELF